MKTCEFCGAGYKNWIPPKSLGVLHPEFSEGKAFEIPSCKCLVDRAEREYQESCRINYEKANLERFSKLNLGNPLTDIPKDFTMPNGNWEDVNDIPQGTNYVIYGPPGRGKTTAIRCIAWKLCKLQVKLRGGPVTEILHKLKNMETIGEYYDYLVGGQVLILDDLDKILGTTYETEKLFSLVDFYSSRRQSILVSLNVDPRNLIDQVKNGKYNVPAVWFESIMSRIMGGATVIHLKERPNYRTPAQVITA